MKEYLKPEAEYISLVAEDIITTAVDENGEPLLDGELGTSGSIF